MSFPVGEDTALQGSFHQLVKECEPATFGKGNKDVFDEEYRKAGKMDTENFCTNFTPYEYWSPLLQMHRMKADIRMTS